MKATKRWTAQVRSGAAGAHTTPLAASSLSTPSRTAGWFTPTASPGSRLDHPGLRRRGPSSRFGPRGVDVSSGVRAASQDRALVVNDLEAVRLDPVLHPFPLINLALGLVEGERSQPPALDHDPNGPAGLADDGLAGEPHGGSRADPQNARAASLKRGRTQEPMPAQVAVSFFRAHEHRHQSVVKTPRSRSPIPADLICSFIQ